MRPSHSWMKSCCGNWVLGHQDHLQGRNCCGMSLNCFCCLSIPWTGEHNSWLGLRRVCHLLHWMWSSWSRHKGSFFTNSSLYFRLFQSLFHCIISDFSLVSTAWHCEQKATEEAYFDRQSVYSDVQWCTVVYSGVQCGGGGCRSTGSQPSVTMFRDEPGEVQELRDELNMRVCIFPCPAMPGDTFPTYFQETSPPKFNP